MHTDIMIIYPSILVVGGDSFGGGGGFHDLCINPWNPSCLYYSYGI